MSKRYTEILFSQTKKRITLGLALRDSLKGDYKLSDLRADFFAGLIVALVAIPLAMAFGIASGVAPEHGVFTTIVAGFFIALLGGSRFQVSGPTAAFVVILAPIPLQFGIEGLLLAGFMAGVILFAMGVARVGKFIRYIPHPVTTGFTAGIALVIATLQLKEFFGLSYTNSTEYLANVRLLFANLLGISWADFAIGSFALLILLLWPRLKTIVPSAIVALAGASLAGIILKSQVPEMSFATIGSRFGHIDFMFRIDWPWNFGTNSAQTLTFEMLRALLPSAFAIAILGAIESLLSATIADGITQTKHDPDSELMALGVGNILCPFVGGIAATGAIARTATNIRFGARSPLSAMFHAAITLVCVLLLAEWIVYLPMAALAALLLVVAYNMSDIKHFVHITRVAPRSDVFVLWTCFLLTTIFDMVIGVSAGVVLAALLFMRRMATMTSSRVLDESTNVYTRKEIPKDVLVYEIIGPLFFGAAESATSALQATNSNRAVIFLLEKVPMLDMTGLVAFESTIQRLSSKGKIIYLVGLAEQPKQLMTDAGILRPNGQVKSVGSIDEALSSFSHQQF